MSPPEMKPNAQYRNFMLLCSHGRGGDTLKLLQAFKVLLKILDNGTCVMIKGCVGVKTA